MGGELEKAIEAVEYRRKHSGIGSDEKFFLTSLLEILEGHWTAKQEAGKQKPACETCRFWIEYKSEPSGENTGFGACINSDVFGRVDQEEPLKTGKCFACKFYEPKEATEKDTIQGVEIPWTEEGKDPWEGLEPKEKGEPKQ